MKENSSKINNSGFSLLELLIVIAILSIMLVGAVWGFNIVNNANVAKAANNFENVLDTARAQAMAKGPDAGMLTFTMVGGKLFYQMGDPATAERIELCASAVTVSYFFSDYASRSGGNVFADGTTVTLIFNQDGTVRQSPPNTFTKMIFSHGSRNSEVILYTETGDNKSAMFYN